MKVKLREHEWVRMTMQPVEVIGTDPEGVPFGLGTDDVQEGVNCRNCGQPYPSDDSCKGDA